ncbi:MAG: helix-turn-helix domain-containing protein [Campylobacterales bacterium]|nr:helix-turn-helix domain-containing protein [Campylobacterales bacterium]
MSRIATVRDDISAKEIRKAIKSTSDGIFRLRLMIVEKLVAEPNLSLQKVAKALIVNRETVTKCLQLFNEGGIEALKPKQAGRKEGNPKYDDSIFQKLIETLKSQETPWSVYQMQNHIRHTYNIEIPESTIYYRLSKMGYSKKANNDYKKSKIA